MGDPAPRGVIDPFIGIGFKLGPPIDSSGQLLGGRKFANIGELQTLLAADADGLLRNLTHQFAIYGTGRPMAFVDREAVAAIVAKTKQEGGGVRTLLHEMVASELFRTR